MARLALLFLAAVVATCNADESATALRRGHAAVVEEDTPVEHRELFGWFSLLFLLGGHPVDCCKPQPPIGPPHHEWERICPNLGCQSDSSSSNETSSYSESYSAESAAEQDSQASTSNNGSTTISSAAGYWPLIAAALAAATAIGAAIVGQRRERVGNHQLKGSVARRMDLFSNFADRALCNQARPERVVEMSASKDDYRLA